ncbi:hypothetical protein [Methanobrevibacter sp.]|uniref:hypothetical protein n=1 Tax=Methanobrevibacter sp. TaxID=66852 RepID=UPI00388FF294
MPYDYYDYFLKRRNSKIFTETENLVRQKLWRETFDVVESQGWKDIIEKIRRTNDLES